MVTAPTFREAANYELPMGRSAGMTIDNVASTNYGLHYLDAWRERLIPKCAGLHSSANEREICRMLNVYLDDPTIAKDLTKCRG